MNANEDIHIVAARIRGHRFVWLYTEQNRADALRSVGRMASDPEFDLDWLDAMQMTGREMQAIIEMLKAR